MCLYHPTTVKPPFFVDVNNISNTIQYIEIGIHNLHVSNPYRWMNARICVELGKMDIYGIWHIYCIASTVKSNSVKQC